MVALYMAWRSEPFEDFRLNWATFDGRGDSPQWQLRDRLDDRGSKEGPALAVFNDKLYMAWRGIEGDRDLFWSTLELRQGESRSWSPQNRLKNRGSFTAPALAAFNGKLYMAWRGIEDDHRLFWATFEGQGDWSDPEEFERQGSNSSPALAVFRNRLYMAWRGADDDQRLFWATFDENTKKWLPLNPLSDRASAAGPALVVFREKLFMFWRGVEDDQHLFFSTFDGEGVDPQWSDQRRIEPPLDSFNAPAIGAFRGVIYIARIGRLSEFAGMDPPPSVLHTDLRYTKFDGENPVLPTRILPASSVASPALAVFPEPTRSLKRFLESHGFDPTKGTEQAGRGSLQEMMG